MAVFVFCSSPHFITLFLFTCDAAQESVFQKKSQNEKIAFFLAVRELANIA